MATASGGQKKMTVVPLAPRALSYPHTYDPANEGEFKKQQNREFVKHGSSKNTNSFTVCKH